MTDCISRQAAIDALNEYFARIGKLKRRGLTEGEKAISLDTVGAINTLPSAQPVKHGKWIDEGYYADYTNVSAWRCSECGWHMIGYDHELFRYCPSCGSRMEEHELERKRTDTETD